MSLFSETQKKTSQGPGKWISLVEAVPPELGQYLASQLDIPVYGIGGGWA